MVVIKRDGREVPFNKGNIANAIQKAFDEVGRFQPVQGAKETTALIANRLYSRYKKRDRAISVEDIQDDVEIELMREKQYEVAQAYIRYRHQHEIMRNSTALNGKILSIVDGVNEEVIQENSNKNPTILSTQRDYIAGEMSKEITLKELLPDDIRQAHEDGIIHFHDSDYYVQRMHNCFSRYTEFVTDRGVRSFGSCRDGEVVNVLTKDGNWAPATVRMYGKRTMQTVKLTSGSTEKFIKCTPDHRWILKDGTVTTNLSVGDRLWMLPEMNDSHVLDMHAFCLGMVLGDGYDFTNGNNTGEKNGIRIRLCGDKIAYIENFIECGYMQSSEKFENGDVVMSKNTKALKSTFVESAGWRYMSAESQASLFAGYYAADGSRESNMISTADDRMAQMIREISCTAGYHITSEQTIVRDTEFKKEAVLYIFHFMRSQPSNRNWIVKDIKDDKHIDAYDAWCVEEPSTHTFTLAGGIVTGNCDLVNLEDMLQNGTVISGTMIERPHSFSTACNIATQIIAQVASNQYGGQSISLSHLAPFVDVSRQKIKEQVMQEYGEFTGHYPVSDKEVEEYNKIVDRRLHDEIKRGIQTIQYQVVTLMTTNGQAPFITVFMYLNEVEDGQTKDDLAMIIEETVRQRHQGVKNEDGVWITPAFPKLIYVLEEDNITESSKYWYLTKLCAQCSAKRLVPDYISEKKMKELKIDQNGNGQCYTCMGCRSFLTPYVDENGKPKYYGRFNQGVVTINLPDVALTARAILEDSGENGANGEEHLYDIFWEVFNDRLELCHRALRLRHERLLGTLSDASPIHWQNGALARLKKGETIDKLLYGGYSTISLGYAGLYECVKAMTGKSHTDEEAKPFALAVMRRMNDKCKEWKEAENIDYSLYGTPIESTTYKFAKSLQKRFGIIPGITDKNYITNSYHVHVTEKIDAFTKLSFESEFQKLSPGGAISYVETANLSDNIEAVLSVIKYIYENIMYAELNTKSDYCQECGYSGEILIVPDENGKLVWKCPNCGSRDRTKMNIARRTCGYIGTNDFNQGRTQEIKERYVHLGGE